MTSDGSDATTAAFRIGRWRVYPDRLAVVGPAGSRTLEPMSMRLLLALAAKAPETLSRDQIVDELWQGRIVTDDAINKQVSKLRATLADPGQRDPLIQTVPKVGIRLCCEPRPFGLRAAAKSRLGWWAVGVVALGALTGLLLRSASPVPELIEEPLTAAPGIESHPAISADGRRLAYLSTAGTGPARLLVRSMAHDDARVASPAGVEPTVPAWSPGGKLAFAGRSGGECRIYIQDSATEAHPVAQCVAAEAGGLSWLDDNTLVVSDRPGAGQSFRLSALDVGSGRSRPLLAPPGGSVGDTRPLVSRDGKTIYFLRSATVGSSELQGWSVADGKLRRFAAGGQINGFALGPDDSLIVSARRGESGYAMWKLQLNDQQWTRLSPGSAPDIAGSADGRTFAYAQVQRQTVLWRLPLDGDAPGGPLTPSTRADWCPVVSPDGRTLAFLSDRSGSEEVWLVDLRTGGVRKLSDFGGPRIQDVAWAPDSSAVFTSVPRAGQFDMVSIDLDGGRLRTWARTELDERQPGYGPDGRSLLFVRRSGMRFDLRSLDLATGSESFVMSGVMREVPAPAARSVLYARAFESGLWQRMPDGTARKLADFPDVTRMRDIAVTGSTAWTVKPEQSGQRLVAIDLGTGRQRAGRLLPGIARPSGLAVANGQVIYARSLRIEADLVALRLRD